jgi:hypothetical protein
MASTVAPSATADSLTTNLGSASAFSVLAAAAATIPGSYLPGEVGAGADITDDSNTFYGSVKHANGSTAVYDALADARIAYDTFGDLPDATIIGNSDLGGQTLTPGVYHSVEAITVTRTLIFDAENNPDAVFIIRTDAALNTTAGTNIELVNGAKSENIFWTVAAASTLGASSSFEGTILSVADITVGATSHFDGRAISLGDAVTLDADTFKK